MPTSMRKFYITSNTIAKRPLLQCYLLEPAWLARLIAHDCFISRVPPESFLLFHGSCCCPCLAVWPREKWEERPQPAKWSYACQLKTLVNNDNIDYSTSIQTSGYTSLVISLFSSQCAASWISPDHARASLANFYVDAALKSMVFFGSFTPNDLYSDAFPCTSTAAAFWFLSFSFFPECR